MSADAVAARLAALADPGYRAFQASLIPTLGPGRILGVRMPALRALAKELAGTPEAEAFLSALPHAYYDEDNLHGLLVCALRGYERCAGALEAFLPYVDNWATCDLLRPRCFERRPAGLERRAALWLNSPHTYTARFGIAVYMCYYLGEGFSAAQLEAAAARCCGDYYVDMMIAWYLATALAKQPEAALELLEGARLSAWVRQKTIQKALESRRVDPALKERLRRLRREGR